jgi:hypothetical protein
MILEYIDDPNVVVIYFFADTAHPYTCNFWGEHGIYPEFPILVEGKSHGIHEWFNIGNSGYIPCSPQKLQV